MHYSMLERAYQTWPNGPILAKIVVHLDNLCDKNGEQIHILSRYDGLRPDVYCYRRVLRHAASDGIMNSS